VGGRGVSEEDRELLMLLGAVGIRVGEMVTGLFEDSLSCDEQRLFEQQLRELAEGFGRRVVRWPVVVEGEIM
jgi:hypothetical protein